MVYHQYLNYHFITFLNNFFNIIFVDNFYLFYTFFRNFRKANLKLLCSSKFWVFQIVVIQNIENFITIMFDAVIRYLHRIKLIAKGSLYVSVQNDYFWGRINFCAVDFWCMLNYNFISNIKLFYETTENGLDI